MAAFDFPNSPNTNDTHTENGVTWKYNGYAWDRVESSGPANTKNYFLVDPFFWADYGTEIGEKWEAMKAGL